MTAFDGGSMQSHSSDEQAGVTAYDAQDQTPMQGVAREGNPSSPPGEQPVAPPAESVEAPSSDDGTDGPGKKGLSLSVGSLVVLVSSLLVVLAMILMTPQETSISLEDEDVVNPPVDRIEDEEWPEDELDASDDYDDEDSSEDDYQYADDVLGVYEARATAADPDARARNLLVAARALDGIEIEAGASFSFNEAIGEPSPERGYEDVQGGESAADAVDQVATALYVASLKAGLSVPTRYAHVIAVDYAPLGMDAAVTWGMDDLIIQNDLSDAVTIQATASDTSITVSIFGVVTDPDIRRDVSVTTIDTYTRPASEVYEDPLAQGYLSSDSIRFSVVKTFLETYRNDEEKSVELLHVDTYQMPNASTERSGEESESSE